MSTNAQIPDAVEVRPGIGVELNGLNSIDESERKGSPSSLFWPWFAANVSVFALSYGTFVLGFGISVVQAVIVSLVGIVASFLACGVVAIAGKRGSAPTMILSRAAFGVLGQKIPGVFSWLISIGWETFLAITATLATATILRRLGWGGGTSTKIVAIVVIAAIIVLASVAGYHVIMKLQSILTWITGIVTIAYIALTFHRIDFAALGEIRSGSPAAMIGALIFVMTGFGLGWINIAADWSRYQKRTAPGGRIVFWNTFGAALAPILLVVFGVALAASDAGLRKGIANDPVGTLATALPTWFLVPFLLAAVLGLVSGAVLGIYSSGLTLLSLGLRIPRPAAALVDGLILTLGTVYVVFVSDSFIGPFQSFLITLGVPVAAWAGIMIADIALRREDYDDAALFDRSGRYRAVDVVSVATMIGVSFLGWGLVVNGFAEAAAWNNWQGYLLEPLGLGGKDGTWAAANLGVLVALVLGFAITWFLRRGTIARQERGPSSGENRTPPRRATAARG